MTMRSRFLKLLLLYMITALAMVACGSGGDDEPLPTLAPTLDTTTQSELPPGVEEVSTEDVTAEGPPVAELPGDEVPPGVDPSQTSATAEDSGLPFDDSEGPPGAAGSDTEIALKTEFDTLAPGDQVRVEGMLTVIDDRTTDPNEPYVVLTDEQGNQLRVMDLAFPVVEMNRDQLTTLGGIIAEAAETDGPLVLRATGGSGDDSFDPGSSESVGGDESPDFLDEGPPVAARIETPFVLEENLTALETYDALVEALDTQMEDADLILIRGNIDLGWEIRFDRAEDGTAVAYFALPDGTVQMAPGAPTTDEIDEVLQPFDRAEVVVDSDTAAEMLVDDVETNSPVDTLPILLLRARRDDTIVWEIEGPSSDSIDATIQPE